jgi:hypothetical protein
MTGIAAPRAADAPRLARPVTGRDVAGAPGRPRSPRPARRPAPAGPSSGRTAQQRRKHRDGTLTPDREQLLTSLGALTDPDEAGA